MSTALARMKVVRAQAQVVTCQMCDLREKCTSPVPMTVPMMLSHRSTGATSGPERKDASARTHLRSSTPTGLAPFIVVGEAPGRLEDYKGKPFIGPSGQRLRKSLEYVGLDPNAGYYLNAVSCWPHGKPDKSHVRQCHDNLKAQLDAVDVEHVLVCGAVALEALVPHAKLSLLAGERMWIPIHGKFLYPVFHPSAILRKKSRQARELWENELEFFAADVVNAHDTIDMLPRDLSYVSKCVYCLARTWDGSPVCRVRSHVENWRKDQKWQRPIPPQMTMELGV